MRAKRTYIFGVILTGVLSAMVVFGIYQDIRAEKYANEIKMDYQRSFTEMVQYVDDLKLSLEKSQFVNDPYQMMRLSEEIYRQAAFASANLAMLPLKTEPLENLSEFLNQSGDYARALSFKMLSGTTVSEKEYENLSNLTEYASIVATALDRDLEDLYNGTLDIRRVAEGATASGIDKAMGEIEDQLHDYPALIYDGPFSSHLTDKESVFLNDKPEITKEEAVARAKAFAGMGKRLKCVEETGNIPAYYLYDEDNLCSIALTKNGGYLLSYLNDRNIGEATIDVAEAKIIGAQFLKTIGFENMRENYYETISNVAVINYASYQEGYTVYPDLVKVKVALDTGEVVGCETRGYLMYHKKRDIPTVKVSVEDAKAKINPNVTIKSTTLAIIPKDDGREDFCWQVEGQIDDRRCLIYVNTQTGAEEKIFLLIESPTGVLAV